MTMPPHSETWPLLDSPCSKFTSSIGPAKTNAELPGQLSPHPGESSTVHRLDFAGKVLEELQMLLSTFYNSRKHSKLH